MLVRDIWRLAREESKNHQCLLFKGGAVWCMVVVAVHTCHMTHFHKCALLRQSLAYQCYGNNVNSNFIQILKLCGLDILRNKAQITKKTGTYTLQEVSKLLHYSQFFCTMSGEYTCASNREAQPSSPSLMVSSSATSSSLP